MARILIVEDEANLAKGIQFNFEIEGYEVEVASDGTEALKRLTAEAPPAHGFDLVILDVMLPGRDGFSIVDPSENDFDPEPNILPFQTVDLGPGRCAAPSSVAVERAQQIPPFPRGGGICRVGFVTTSFSLRRFPLITISRSLARIRGNFPGR